MGGFAPGPHISKGPLCYYLDQISHRKDAPRRLAALRKAVMALEPKGFEGLVPVFRKHIFAPCKAPNIDAICKYLEANWFEDEGGWWPHLQPLEPAFSVGLVKAIDTAIEHALPIDSYWLIIDEGFEMTVSQSPQQVTLMIMTPQPPNPHAHGVWAPDDSKIWVVKDARLGGALEQEHDWQRKERKTRRRRSPGQGRVVSIRVQRPYTST